MSGTKHIILRDLLTQKCAHKKRLLILDALEHVNSENNKLKIAYRRAAPSTNFFQNVIKIHKMWTKCAKMYWFSNFFQLFSHFQVVEYSFRTNAVKNETFINNRKIQVFATFSFKKNVTVFSRLTEQVFRRNEHETMIVCHIKRENSRTKFENRSILATFYELNHVLKKVGRRSSGNLFSIWYFLILHALGYPKSVTFFCARTFGLTIPSAWCVKNPVLFSTKSAPLRLIKSYQIMPLTWWLLFKAIVPRCEIPVFSNFLAPDTMLAPWPQTTLSLSLCFSTLTVAHLLQQFQLWNFDANCHTFWMPIVAIWWSCLMK
jgi:hypothetical protein